MKTKQGERSPARDDLHGVSVTFPDGVTVGIHLYPRYISMGKGIESLSELLRCEMGCNPLSGDVFLFFGKKRDTVKLLRWDRDGFILYQKRLESGTFELPRFQKNKGLYQLQGEAVFLMMRGIPLRNLAFRKRKFLDIGNNKYAKEVVDIMNELYQTEHRKPPGLSPGEILAYREKHIPAVLKKLKKRLEERYIAQKQLGQGRRICLGRVSGLV